MGMTIDNVKEELISILTEIEITGGSMVTSIYKDELKMAIDIIDKYQKFQDQSLFLYMERLKADMVAMLEDLDLQIDESASYNLEVAKVQRLIRDKINVLRGEKDETDKSNK